MARLETRRRDQQEQQQPSRHQHEGDVLVSTSQNQAHGVMTMMECSDNTASSQTDALVPRDDDDESLFESGYGGESGKTMMRGEEMLWLDALL